MNNEKNTGLDHEQQRSDAIKKLCVILALALLGGVGCSVTTNPNSSPGGGPPPYTWTPVPTHVNPTPGPFGPMRAP